MKKFLLNINLSNFILMTPALVLFNNYNQSCSENFMEKQSTNLKVHRPTSWTNGVYDFLNIKERLYVGKEGIIDCSIINGFKGEISGSYFSERNNDVFFTTNTGLFFIKEDTTDALRINGIDEELNGCLFSSKNNDVFFTTNTGLILIKEGTVDALKINNLEGEFKSLFFIKKGVVIIYTEKGLFILWENAINALNINSLEGEFNHIVTSDLDGDIFIFKTKGSFILFGSSTALKMNQVIGILKKCIKTNQIIMNNKDYFFT